MVFHQKNVQYASRRVISPLARISRTLRLTSKLVDLRVGYTKWIRTTSCPSRISSSSVNMMHTCASYLRRDIEVVITGLTRNFVVTLEPPTLNPLIYKGFPQFK